MDSIESILGYLDKLQALPSIALVFASCLVMGYVWRFIKLKWFPNDAIPAMVILWGAIAYCVVADPAADGIHLRVWLMRNLMIGACDGFFAWLTHFIVLKRIEDFIGEKFNLGNTSFFNKDDTCQPDKNNPPSCS